MDILLNQCINTHLVLIGLMYSNTYSTVCHITGASAERRAASFNQKTDSEICGIEGDVETPCNPNV